MRERLRPARPRPEQPAKPCRRAATFPRSLPGQGWRKMVAHPAPRHRSRPLHRALGNPGDPHWHPDPQYAFLTARPPRRPQRKVVTVAREGFFCLLHEAQAGVRDTYRKQNRSAWLGLRRGERGGKGGARKHQASATEKVTASGDSQRGMCASNQGRRI